MADTAARLFGPATLTDTAATLWTVPALTTVVVQHILVTNLEDAGHAVTLSIGADAAGTRIFDETPVKANGLVNWSGFLVLDAAELMQGFADANSALNVTISGVEIT